MAADRFKQNFVQRQLRGLMAALVVEFILGVTLTTLINYDPNKHSAVQTTFLVLHIIVAIGILIGAITRFVFSIRSHTLQGASTVGLISVLVAFAGGGVAAGNGNNLAVFLMALGFVIAFISYGYSIGQISQQRQKPV